MWQEVHLKVLVSGREGEKASVEILRTDVEMWETEWEWAGQAFRGNP